MPLEYSIASNAEQLEKFGYLYIPELVSRNECAELIEGLPALPGAGTRRLLEQPRYQDLAKSLRSSPSLQFALDGLIAVQAILFHKTADINWYLRIHSDSIFPIRGQGNWRSAGIKEELPYVRVPRDQVAGFVAVRVCLDDAAEGDLFVEPGTHWPYNKMMGDRVIVPASLGSVLVLNPSLRHASNRFLESQARRVIHFVFAPPTLPDSYTWCHAV